MLGRCVRPDLGHERAPSRASLSLRVGVTDQAEADHTGAPVVADRAHLRHCWPSGCVVCRGAQAVIGGDIFEPSAGDPPGLDQHADLVDAMLRVAELVGPEVVGGVVLDRRTRGEGDHRLRGLDARPTWHRRSLLRE